MCGIRLWSIGREVSSRDPSASADITMQPKAEAFILKLWFSSFLVGLGEILIFSHMGKLYNAINDTHHHVAYMLTSCWIVSPFMFFAVFVAWLLTQWINCRFFIIYICCFIMNYSTFYSTWTMGGTLCCASAHYILLKSVQMFLTLILWARKWRFPTDWANYC